MAITLRQLIAIPDLKTHAIAGSAGLDRVVTWAHVCELADPTQWLGGGELVMTTGLGLPRRASDQVAYVERLAHADLSGVTIGEQMYAPPLTAQFVAAADRHAFPVLVTAYEVPFAAVARAVLDASQGEDHARLVRTLRIYETMRRAAGAVSGAELLRQLQTIVGCDLFVLDPARGRALFGGDAAPHAIGDALTAAMIGRATPPAGVLHLRAGPYPALALTVPASRAAMLVAVGCNEKPLDFNLLRHVATVAALDIERATVGRERGRRSGAELLAALLDSRIEPEAAELMLNERDFEREPRVLAVCPDYGAPPDLHLGLEDWGLPHLLLRRSGMLIALLPADDEAFTRFVGDIDPAVNIGVSSALGRLGRVPDAYREAQWALRSAQASATRFVRYGDDAALSLLLPRNLSEARLIMQHVLQPIMDYDDAHDAGLLPSLTVFLEHNRSWQRAAAVLHVHKQTLIYRMKRVEQLTGRQLDRTQDVAELWLALRAAQAIGTLPVDEKPHVPIETTNDGDSSSPRRDEYA